MWYLFFLFLATFFKSKIFPKGAGNSIFPLLAANQNPNLHLRAYDYSSHAVKLVQVCFIVSGYAKATLICSWQNNPLYTSPAAGSIHASVWDVTSAEGLPQDVLPGTVDIVILVFVMSALHPDEWGQAINNIQKVSR